MTASLVSAVDFVGGLIGRAYQPDGLNCWELVRQCQRIVFGRELPPVLVAPERRRELVDLMNMRHSYPGWRQVDGPTDSAVVFMTLHGHEASKAACHAGVWLDLDGGGVLHTDASHGVVFDTLPEITVRNWADLSFYLPASALPA